MLSLDRKAAAPFSDDLQHALDLLERGSNFASSCTYFVL